MSELAKLFGRAPDPFSVQTIPTNNCYKCVIDDVFREVSQFAPIVDALEAAQDGDYALMKISTPGGALHSILPLMEAMKNTEARIYMHVESDIASAGTMLLMLADEVIVNPYVSIMFHSASYGYYGHQANMTAHVNHNTAQLGKLVREIYADFLTTEEIDRILDGKELYLTAEECEERFEKRAKTRADRAAGTESFVGTWDSSQLTLTNPTIVELKSAKKSRKKSATKTEA